MILKASQRGGAKQLGVHLMRLDENDHVEVHEIKGFMSGDVIAALKEAQAVSQGTKCRQFLFSVSISPPPHEDIDIATFEDAIERIERVNGLVGHSRVVVFHEKDGRRHAHAVWSRIDAGTMTAKNLPHFKLKLRDLSRSLFLEQEWKLPAGLMNSQARDPRSFTLAEWQEAKRNGVHAGDLKEVIQECWAASDSKAAFTNVLGERGFALAKGHRGQHVAVSHQGQVFAVASATRKRTREIRAKLGHTDDLPGVEEVRQQFKTDLAQTFSRLAGEIVSKRRNDLARLSDRKRTMIERHRHERDLLDQGLKRRWQAEAKARADRFRTGISGIWDRITGAHQRIRLMNEREAYDTVQRDRLQRQAIIGSQLVESRDLQQQIRTIQRESLGLFQNLKQDRRQLLHMLDEAELKPNRKPRSAPRNRRRKPRQTSKINLDIS